MFAELVDLLVWAMPRSPHLERFASFALLVLLLTTLGGLIHAG